MKVPFHAPVECLPVEIHYQGLTGAVRIETPTLAIKDDVNTQAFDSLQAAVAAASASGTLPNDLCMSPAGTTVCKRASAYQERATTYLKDCKVLRETLESLCMATEDAFYWMDNERIVCE
eukprot:5692017-Pyramimonas_sp.AAC.1